MSSVSLHVYDLSNGMAAAMSPALLGSQIDGIWHTGVVVFSREYFFGGGICVDTPNATPYGRPVRAVPLGRTSRTRAEFEAHLGALGVRFNAATYDLFENNCNNFSQACADFLAVEPVPHYILDLPRSALATPMGAALRPMIQHMQGAIRDQSAGHELFRGDSPSPAAAAPPGPPPPRYPELARQLAAPKSLAGATPGLRGKVVAKLREFDPGFAESDAGNVPAILAALRTLEAPRAFPALDLLRMAALAEGGGAAEVAREIRWVLEKYAAVDGVAMPAGKASLLMALRVAVNCFVAEHGARAALAGGDAGGCQYAVLDAAASWLGNGDPGVSVTAAFLCLNVARLVGARGVWKLEEAALVRITCALVERVQGLDPGVLRERLGKGDRGAENLAVELQCVLASLAALMLENAECRTLALTLEVDVSHLEGAVSEPLRSLVVEVSNVIKTSMNV